MAQSTLYFPFFVPPVTGGDFVVIDHIAGLNRLGFDARALYFGADQRHLDFSVPAAVAGQVGLKPNDIVVIGEIHKSLFHQIRSVNCTKVMHNQNPYYTFYGFDSVQQLNDYPLSYIIVPSDFTKNRLLDMGVSKSIRRVHPVIPSYFAPGDKRLQIAFSPIKRPQEVAFIIGSFKSQHPEFADVAWLALSKMSREACAQIMAQSAVYAAFAMLEGLGLMSLEAMASGCQVVGYTGNGGSEYANDDNGHWIEEGKHEIFVQKLSECCHRARSGMHDPRVETGMGTARAYSLENFETQLQETYLEIMGADADKFRK